MVAESNFYSGSAERNRGWRSVQKQTYEITDISFDDVLSAVNPLNHLPFISNATESPISPIAKMAGGALLGGPVGFAVSAINVVFEEARGESVLGGVVNAVLEPDAEIVAKKYRSIADANKRHFNTWNI